MTRQCSIQHPCQNDGRKGRAPPNRGDPSVIEALTARGILGDKVPDMGSIRVEMVGEHVEGFCLAGTTSGKHVCKNVIDSSIFFTLGRRTAVSGKGPTSRQPRWIEVCRRPEVKQPEPWRVARSNRTCATKKHHAMQRGFRQWCTWTSKGTLTRCPTTA